MSESKTILFPNAKPGETFMIGDMKFIRFHNINGQTPVVMKSIAFTSPFGNSNDLRSSDILKKLQEDILPKIAEEVGEENICEFETDLTCLDGMKPYGTMKSRISLPTMDFYRANVEIFDQYNPGKWWWLATPDSAKPHCEPRWILCVAPSGSICNDYYYVGNFGVRPFLILKSSIFESSEE